MKNKYEWTITLRFTELHLIIGAITALHFGLLDTVIPKDVSDISDDEEVIALKDAKEEELTIEEKLRLLRERKIFGIVYIGDQKVYSKRLLDEFLDTKVINTTKLSHHNTSAGFSD